MAYPTRCSGNNTDQGSKVFSAFADRFNMRIFVEWYDPARPEWGGYLVSGMSGFQADLERSVGWWGPPTLVEYRADGEKENTR